MKTLPLLLAAITGIVIGIAGFVAFYLYKNNPDIIPASLSQVVPIFGKPHKSGFLPYWLINDVSPETVGAMDRIYYFGLIIGGDGHLISETKPGEEEPGWNKLKSDKLISILSQAKKKGQSLSLVIHLANDPTITELVSQPSTAAANLIADVQPVMETHGFTDLNLDIETFRHASPEAQTRFTEFVSEVKSGIDGKKLGTLSVDILPRAFINDFLAKPSDLIGLVDQMIVMAYDYHYSGSQYSGPVAPIAGAPDFRTLDIRVTIGETLRQIPKEKVTVGFPFYGYEWESLSPSCPGPVIPGTGKTASAKRIAKLLTECPDCTTSFDETAQVPCTVKPDEGGFYFSHIYYENKESLGKKLAFIRHYGLAGAAFWALGYESEDMVNILNNF